MCGCTCQPNQANTDTMVTLACMVLRLGLYPAISFPAVLGADCCGRVAAVGGDIDTEAPPVGTRVVVDPGVLWGDKAGYPSNMYHILGMAPAGGTLAQYVAVDASQVHECPKHLSRYTHHSNNSHMAKHSPQLACRLCTSAEAAALPLAGLTAYRATFMKGQVKAGQRVLVSGIGGGVATFALQYAVAAGAMVWVTSSSPSKIKAAKELGAKGGVLYTDPQWHKRVVEEAGGPFDAVIDGTGLAPTHSQVATRTRSHNDCWQELVATTLIVT